MASSSLHLEVAPFFDSKATLASIFFPVVSTLLFGSLVIVVTEGSVRSKTATASLS